MVSEESPNQGPEVVAPLLESLVLKGGDFIPQQNLNGVGPPNPLVHCIRERYSSNHGLRRLVIRDCVGLGPSEVEELTSMVDDPDFDGRVGKDTQKDSDSTITLLARFLHPLNYLY
jgi:hypothetical protein